MSARRALALGFRNFLQSPTGGGGLGIAKSDCEVMADGRPRVDCGDWFYAIHGGARQNQLQTGDESYFTLYCTISARCHQPFDRVGPNILEVYHGLDDRADDVWNHAFRYQWGTIGVMIGANQLMLPDNATPPNTYLFVQSLYPVNCSNPEPVPENWFGAASQQQHRTQQGTGDPAPFVGFKTVLTFQGAVVLQELDDALA